MKNKFSIKNLVLTIKSYVQLISIVLKQIFIKSSAAYFYSEVATYLFKLNYLFYTIHYFLKSEENNFSQNLELSIYNWAHLGSAYFDLGDYKRSKYYFEKVYYYDKKDAELIYRLAKCNEILENHNTALLYYEEVIQLDENNFWDPIAAIIMLINCGRKDEAIVFFQVIKKRSKTVVEQKITNSIELILENKLKESLLLLEDILSILKDKEYEEYVINKPTVLLLCYIILKRLNDGDFLLDLFEKEYLLNKEEPYVNYLLAKEYYDLNIKLNLAIKMINVSIKKYKLDPYYFNLKSSILFKIGNYKEAEKVAKKNLLMHPDDEDSKELLAKIPLIKG